TLPVINQSEHFLAIDFDRLLIERKLDLPCVDVANHTLNVVQRIAPWLANDNKVANGSQLQNVVKVCFEARCELRSFTGSDDPAQPVDGSKRDLDFLLRGSPHRSDEDQAIFGN